jgi:uncharacterized membrane protein
VVAVTETHSPPRSRSAVLRILLLDVAPPLVGYYGLRALGASEYVALLTATVLSGLKVTYDAVKARRLDPFACYLLLTFGLSLAVALITTDPKLILAGNTLVNGIGGLLFLGSCVVGTPLTQVVAERFNPDDDEPEPGAEEYRRKAHILLSAMWGVGLIIEVGVRLVVISRVSVDVANGLLSAISWGTVGILIAATFLVGRRLGARWEQRKAAQG